MAWKQLEPTPAHLTYLIVAGFLTAYTLFSVFIRNRMHLSEPPLALVTGIIAGPKGLNALDPLSWYDQDNTMQEFTRLIAGLQVFAVGLELPKRYIPKHYPSLLWLLGPVMAFGWLTCALFVYLIFRVDVPSALVISACLTPTDPVLAASILSNSKFSTRVPNRIKHLLSAESGCNDGVSFPFIYVGLAILTESTAGGAVKEWVLITILWQCVMGVVVGAVFGLLANRCLRFSDARKLIGPASFVVFYLVLAVLSIGVASTLGLDDFLVAFSASVAFSHDGWFARRTAESDLNNILDLIVNSSFFFYLGTVMPWSGFVASEFAPEVTTSRLLLLLLLVLLFRRIPAMLALKPLIPDVRTWSEALFCGHFGPMGVGALFLAIEARAQLETGTSKPLPSPSHPDADPRNRATSHMVFPIICFIVLGSTVVHGLSTAAISIFIHLRRGKHERSHVFGGEEDPLGGMVHEADSEEEEAEEEEDADMAAEWEERRGRLVLPPS